MMRRLTGFLLLAGLALSNVGCFAIVSSEKAVKVTGRQAVVMNDEIYIVDVDKGCVSKIDPQAVSNAAVITAAEEETAEE